MQRMITVTQAISPNTPLGTIPKRTASITGQQRYPFLRWDDNGTPFSSNPAVWQPDPTDPGIRVAMTEQLIASALRREAIAPMWEVNTAKMQQDSEDPLAGLTEAERAARLGLGARYEATTTKVIALRAMNTPGKRSNHAEMMGKTHAFSANDAYYEFNSDLGRFYAGQSAKGLMKLPANDHDWRGAA